MNKIKQALEFGRDFFSGSSEESNDLRREQFVEALEELHHASDGIITEYAVMLMNAGYEDAADLILENKPTGAVYQCACKSIEGEDV